VELRWAICTVVSIENDDGMSTSYRDFYEQIDRDTEYTVTKRPEEHAAYAALNAFVRQYDLAAKKCLEIGASKGLFQDLVDDYVGLDIATSLSRHFHKPYHTVREDGSYPFGDDTFDAIWGWNVFEHIPNLDQALDELVRVLKPGGVVYFSPAWQCRPWAAQGYAVRPYSDFDWKGKLIKASIPVRDSVAWRSLFVFPKRILRHLLFLAGKRGGPIPTTRLTPNYEKFWVSDADAVHSIDPHDAILWFESRGLRCLSHPLNHRALLVRTGAIVIQKARPC
jgi:SAM-dependent methyltransferase